MRRLAKERILEVLYRSRSAWFSTGILSERLNLDMRKVAMELTNLERERKVERRGAHRSIEWRVLS